MENLRWQCESSDEIHKTWTRHNLESYGSQDIHDPQSNLHLTTEFYKKPSGSKGGDWSVRISGKSRNKKEEQISLFFLLEGENFKLVNGRNNGLPSPIVINGVSKVIGKHSIHLTDQSGYKGEAFTKLEQVLEKFHFIGKKEPFTKQILLESLRKKSEKDSKVEIFTLANAMHEESRSVIIQKIITTPFSFEISLISHEAHSDTSSQKKTVQNMTGKKLTELFNNEKKLFDKKFLDVFPVGNNVQFGQSALSNLIGGIGYFTGASIHQYGNSEPKQTTPNRALLTGTPSRTFFPRGFLWDEGFHLNLIKKWNPNLFKDILSHWLNLMDSDGWIAREQILGEEAHSKVPSQFQKQANDIANPPTIFLSILSLLDDIKSTVSVGLNGETVQASNSPDLEFCDRYTLN
jgi:mannosyl-oligosaccharide glucosidase